MESTDRATFHVRFVSTPLFPVAIAGLALGEALSAWAGRGASPVTVVEFAIALAVAVVAVTLFLRFLTVPTHVEVGTDGLTMVYQNRRVDLPLERFVRAPLMFGPFGAMLVFKNERGSVDTCTLSRDAAIAVERARRR